MKIEDKAYSEKWRIIKEEELFKPYFYFMELRESIYKNIVKEVMDTIEYNLELSESIILAKCCKIQDKRQQK